SPRGALRRFVEGTQTWEQGGREMALETLDLSFMPRNLRVFEGQLLADYLKRILDRTHYVLWQEIPNDPDLPNPYVHYRHAHGEVVIERVPGDSDNDSRDRWLFSAATMQAAPSLYSHIEALPRADGLAPNPPLTSYFWIRETIREHAPGLLQRWLTLEAWQWLSLALWIAGAALASWIVYWVTLGLVGLFTPVGGGSTVQARAKALARPLSLCVLALLMMTGISLLGAVTRGLDVLWQGMAVAGIVFGAWFAWRFVDELGGYFVRRAARTPGYADEIVASLTTAVIKLGIVLCAVMATADRCRARLRSAGDRVEHAGRGFAHDGPAIQARSPSGNP
ncbi:MAG: hypothetical protein P8Y82_12390, partial [Methyloceanibacter sp.]